MVVRGRVYVERFNLTMVTREVTTWTRKFRVERSEVTMVTRRSQTWTLFIRTPTRKNQSWTPKIQTQWRGVRVGWITFDRGGKPQCNSG